MKSIVRFSVVLALVALVGCGENGQALAPEAADLAKHDSAMSLKKTSVPFKSSVSGALSFTNDPSIVELTADGNASHLGKINYSGTVVITSQTPTQIIDDLTETLTAANGDQLTLLCHQEANLTSPGMFESTNDSWKVIGGTGRFSGATGCGSGTTHVDLISSTFTKECVGTITY